MFQKQNSCLGSKRLGAKKQFLVSEQQNLFPQLICPRATWKRLRSQQCFLLFSQAFLYCIKLP